MKKGIVLEVKKKEALVLSKEGTFHAVRRRKGDEWSIGDEIDLTEPLLLHRHGGKRRFAIPAIALVASCLILFVTLIGFGLLGPDRTAVAYVHLDLNPSVEMSVNKSMEVLSIKGLNRDGQHLIQYLEDWSHRSLTNVLVNMLIIAQDQGYLTQITDVLVTTSGIGEENIYEYQPQIVNALHEAEVQLAQSGRFSVSTAFSSEEAGQEQLEITEVGTAESAGLDQTPEERFLIFYQINSDQVILEQAQSVGLSPGKYMIYLHAQEEGLDLTMEEIRERSISDLSRELGGLGPILSRPSALPSGTGDEAHRPGAWKEVPTASL